MFNENRFVPETRVKVFIIQEYTFNQSDALQVEIDRLNKKLEEVERNNYSMAASNESVLPCLKFSCYQKRRIINLKTQN